MVETHNTGADLPCAVEPQWTLEREQQRPNNERDTEFRYEVVHCGLLDGRIYGTVSGRMTGREDARFPDEHK